MHPGMARDVAAGGSPDAALPKPAGGKFVDSYM
jgi:hypothetical protein